MAQSSERDEVVARGRQLYEQHVAPRLTAEAEGQFLVIDVETGDFELDQDHLAASDRAAAKHPGAQLFAIRVGYPALGRMGLTVLMIKSALLHP